MKKVIIYSDGACSYNPGKGGYGTVLTFKRQDKVYVKELFGGFRKTTNNRMELLGAIVGLEALKEKCDVEIYTDSKYVVDSVEKGWVFAWEKKANFNKKKNKDLWLRFLEVYREHQVKLFWVKGHSGHEMNERCDKLAVNAYKQGKLEADTVYENGLS